MSSSLVSLQLEISYLAKNKKGRNKGGKEEKFEGMYCLLEVKTQHRNSWFP